MTPGPVLVRAARPDDADALAAMWQRCTSDTRYQRFHGVVAELPSTYLRHCLFGHDGHIARVAELVTRGYAGDQPQLVGLASAGPVTDTPHIYELGVLVEDSWQRRGIGGALARELFAAVYANGIGAIRMDISRSQPNLISHLLATAPVLRTSGYGTDVSLDVDVPAYVIAARPRPVRPPRREVAPTRSPQHSAALGCGAPGPA
jgi:ribosomal protein S18 acetylase RimI-like enzyme